jgi:hypothetical protein
MRCCKCKVEVTTQDALAGQVIDTDEGAAHVECLEPGDTIVEMKMARDIHLSPEAAGRQEQAYHDLLAGR